MELQMQKISNGAKKIVLALGILLVGGILLWPYIQKNLSVGIEPEMPMAEHAHSIPESLKEIMDSQQVSSSQDIDCARIENEELMELGDAVMAKIAGNETQHEKMEDMTGGEESAATMAVHKTMGENYLGCNDAAGPNENILIMLRLHAQKAEYLTDAKRMTLYTFASDKLGVSNCKDKCLETWPPYLVPSGTKEVSVVSGLGIMRRGDNLLQFTFRGMPLYFYAQDKKAGDALGDDFKDLWRIVKP